ncbi:MAG: FliO/MopB family protein [Vicinamibacterales bacterium]
MSSALLALSQADSLAGGGPSISLQAYLTVAVVLAVLGGAAWALRRTNTFRRSQLPIVVESAVPLGERRSLVVVSVEGRRLLLGLTPHSVGLVTELKGQPPDFGRALDASLAEPKP